MTGVPSEPEYENALCNDELHSKQLENIAPQFITTKASYYT